MASILVCDTEPVIVELLSSLLEAEGYLVPIAHTGAEAVALARLHRPDLLLLDMDLSDMPGIDVLRQVRAFEPCRDTSVIFLTGVEDPSRMAEAMELGGVTYIFKRSMRSEDLISTISQQIPAPPGTDNIDLPLAAPSQEITELSEVTRKMADPDRVLTFIGGWFLRQKIGRGGMGDVYMAEQGQELAAIKILPRGCDQAGDIGQRFLSEISILRRLNHPHIVRYLDSGISSARPYLVMEFIEALNLRQFTRKHGTIDSDMGRKVLRQMAAGLACARDQGITHRDIKPSNILAYVDPSDHTGTSLKSILCDFGIAHIRDTRLGAESKARLTPHGMLIGTPTYLSPEQAGGQPTPDQRQDIYGLGATLYAAITGSPPFRGEIEEVLARKQVEDVDMQPLEEAIDGDPDLIALIEAMLRRDPERRTSNWEAVMAAVA